MRREVKVWVRHDGRGVLTDTEYEKLVPADEKDQWEQYISKERYDKVVGDLDRRLEDAERRLWKLDADG